MTLAETVTDFALAKAYGRLRRRDVALTSVKGTVFHMYDPTSALWLERGDHDVKRDFAEVMGAAASSKIAQADAQAKAATCTDAAKKALQNEAEAWEAVHAKVESARQRCNCLSDIKSLLANTDLVLKLDANPDLLPLPNAKVVDLRTGALHDRQRDHFFTFELEATYLGIGAPTPLIDAFMNDLMVGDAAMVAYLQRLLGYAMTGHVTQQLLSIWSGSGGNGKGVLCRALERLLRRLFVTMDSDVLIKRPSASAGAHSAHLYKLKGACLAVLQETQEDDVINDKAVKDLSGGDSIACRPLYRDPVDVVPQFLPVLVTNSVPKLHVDGGIRRRIVIIPFRAEFKVESEFDAHNTLHRLADPDVDARMASDDAQSQLLTWLVQGAVQWYADPDLKSRKPAVVASFTQEYLAENDDIQTFLDGCVTLEPTDPSRRASTDALYEAYCALTEVSPLSHKAFVAGMRRKGHERQQVTIRTDDAASTALTPNEREQLFGGRKSLRLRVYPRLQLQSATVETLT